MIRGAKEHTARMRRLSGPAMVREVTKVVYAAADLHAADAALSITTGAVSGAGHIPSKPGEPPNADTHALDRSIHVEKLGPLKANSVADAPYALKLEKGDSSVAERPYMRPAAKRVRPKAEKLMALAIERIAAGGRL